MVDWKVSECSCAVCHSNQLQDSPEPMPAVYGLVLGMPIITCNASILVLQCASPFQNFNQFRYLNN